MSDSQKRKNSPPFSGVLMYFPDAIMAIAEHSKKGNDKHNPGEPMRWAREKSKDHADCIARHLIDIGPNWDGVDPELDALHAIPLAWRALALLQTVLERQKEVCGAIPRKEENQAVTFTKVLDGNEEPQKWTPSAWDPNDSNE